MIEIKIAEAFVEIKGDKGKYSGTIRSAKRETSGFATSATKSLKQVSVGLAVVGAAAAAAAVAIGVKLTRSVIRLGTEAVQSFAQLQQGMAEVSTMIKSNFVPALAALTAGVRELSLEVPHGTESLSTALYDLLSASVPVSQSLKALKTSSKAAVAGLSNVKTAANLGTGTANALNIAFSDMDKIFDTAFATVREGKITFAELAGSLGQVLPSAKKMKSSIEEVYGSIAFLTKNAFSADMASVSLARALDALGTKAATLENLGIRVFGPQGEYRGILNIMRDISRQIQGLSDQAKVNFFEKMGFDIRAARAIIVMSENLEGLEKTLSSVAQSAGATEVAYSRMVDTLVNKWEIMKNTVTELSRTIVEGLANAASEALDSFTKIGKNLTLIIKNFKDYRTEAIAVFTDIALIGFQTTGLMLKSMIKLVSTAAEFMWTPLVTAWKSTGVQLQDRAGRTIINMWADITKKDEAGRKKLLDRRAKSTETEMKAITDKFEKDFGPAFEKAMAEGSAALTEGLNAFLAGLGQIDSRIGTLSDKMLKVQQVSSGLKALGNDLVKFFKSLFVTPERPSFEGLSLEMSEQTKKELKIIGERNEAAEKLYIKDMENLRKAAEQGAIWDIKEANKLADFQEKWRKKKLEKDREALEALKRQVEDFVTPIRFAFEDMFVDLFSGNTKNLWEQFFEDLKQIALRKLAEIAATKIFESIIKTISKERAQPTTGEALTAGGKRAAGAALGAFAGSFFGPAGTVAGASIGQQVFGSFANGGIVRRPTIALVGEKGPEAIIPIGQQGSGSTVPRPIIFSGDIIIHDQDLTNFDTQRMTKQIQQGIGPALAVAAANGIPS